MNEDLAVSALSLADSCRDGFTGELWVSVGRTIKIEIQHDPREFVPPENAERCPCRFGPYTVDVRWNARFNRRRALIVVLDE
jgi:hypothetical protein